MDEPDIYSRLDKVFEDVFDEEVELSPELSAKDVPAWDSLAHIRLMITIEKAFKVRFSAIEIGKLESVGDLVALIQSKL